MGRLFRKLKRGLSEAQDTYDIKRKKLPWYKAAWEAFYLSDLFDVLSKPYYTVNSFYNKCRTVIEFLPIVWEHKDWDYGYIFKLNVYLHQRLYKGLYVKGLGRGTKQAKRGLIAVTELYKRLHEEDVARAHWDAFYKKWNREGDDFFIFKTKTDANGRKSTYLVDPVEEWATPDQIVQYQKERKALYKFEKEHQKRHVELLNKLIAKNYQGWWD